MQVNTLLVFLSIVSYLLAMQKTRTLFLLVFKTVAEITTEIQELAVTDSDYHTDKLTIQILSS